MFTADDDAMFLELFECNGALERALEQQYGAVLE